MTRTSPSPALDLGYHWIWTYGHLFPAIAFGAGAAALALLGAPWWAWMPLAAVALWALAGFLVMRLGVRMNEIPRFRVSAFQPDGAARVLDVGCGSGRLSIAIARARPRVTVVGLDNFSATYIHGHALTKTEANFAAAGIADRASIQEGDMRSMPFPDASFDAAASSAAIDHLGTEEIRATLGEVHRVLKPGGQFLLVVVVPNLWLTIAFGPLMHGRLQGRAFWRAALRDAGFSLQGEGGMRTTTWFLSTAPPR